MPSIIKFIFVFLCLSPSAQAVKIEKVEKNEVILNTEGEKIRVGQKFWAADSNGKLRAIMQIKTLDGNKAQAQIIKGKVKVDYKIGKTGTKPTASSGGSLGLIATKNSWAALIGFSSSSMIVRPTANSSVSLSGSSMDLTILHERPLLKQWSLKLTGKYHTLKVAGKSNSTYSCTSEDCFVDISYLAGEAIASYNFLKISRGILWAGGGLGFSFAFSKASNILDTETITTNETILLSTGLNWPLNSGSFIPLQLDYVIYPDNQATSANQMIVSLGYGKTF